jgi:hypothetical protein
MVVAVDADLLEDALIVKVDNAFACRRQPTLGLGEPRPKIGDRSLQRSDLIL